MKLTERQKGAFYFYLIMFLCLVAVIYGVSGSSGGMMNPGSPVP